MEAAKALPLSTSPPDMSGSKLAIIPSPDEKGFFSPEEAQGAALESLPTYDVQVVKRRAYGEPETDEHGSYYQETVRYSDGAVRLCTIGTPHAPNSDHVVHSADPWVTGANGFNNIEIKQLVRNGFHVAWSHHHGRHAPWPTNRQRLLTMARFLSSKSIAKAAAQEHALLDNLAATAPFDTASVIRKGYSRSAMTGEAFIAQSAQRGDRQVVWSDLEAACFLQGVGITGLAKILVQQLPYEMKALLDIALSVQRGVPAGRDGSTMSLLDYHGTFDIHPLNVAHEAAWVKLLVGGDTGVFARAVPLHTRGLRTTYKHDIMAQAAKWQDHYAVRPNLTLVEKPGAHFSGAAPEILAEKDARYYRLGRYIVDHEGDLSTITAADILPPPE